MPKLISDEEFIKLWGELKSCQKISTKTGISIRAVKMRRRAMESRYGLDLQANEEKPFIERHSARINIPIQNGIVIVFSDASPRICLIV
jgi:DNA-binding CsgD family transcriptional regulator